MLDPIINRDILTFVSLCVFSMCIKILFVYLEIILCTANNPKFAVFPIYA